MRVQLTKFARYNSVVLFAFIVIGSQSACKKNPKPEDEGNTRTRSELTKDSIFLYAKQTFYWNNLLPGYDVFNPRQYKSKSTDLENFNDEVSAFKTYAPLDKYSFVDDGSLSDELGGVAGDYGFSVFFSNANSLKIKSVNPGSPADKLGLKRGYVIIKVNNRSNLTTSDADIDFLIDAVFGDNPSVSLSVFKPDFTTSDFTIDRATYSINPVMLDSVYTVGSKKVGYIVFSSFTTNAETKLVKAFQKFESQNVSELIVDLRYNGGGSVATAELLSNLIVPIAKSGELMYTTFWTKTMQDGQATILLNQPLLRDGKLDPCSDCINRKYATYADIDFSTASPYNKVMFEKAGGLNVSRVYFLVTGSTASASELVINNLRPVVDLKLIGRKTYGKPVGFFPIHIDKLDLYTPQFETKNSLNSGGYFNGINVDKDAVDDIEKDFGDRSELYLSYALKYAEKLSFSVSSSKQNVSNVKKLTKAEVDYLTIELDRYEFKGLVNDKALPHK